MSLAFQQQSHSINTIQCDPNNILKVWSIKWPAGFDKTVHVFISAVPWSTAPSARCVYEEAFDADSLCWTLVRISLRRDIILALVWNVCVCFFNVWRSSSSRRRRRRRWMYPVWLHHTCFCDRFLWVNSSVMSISPLFNPSVYYPISPKTIWFQSYCFLSTGFCDCCFIAIFSLLICSKCLLCTGYINATICNLFEEHKLLVGVWFFLMNLINR